MPFRSLAPNFRPFHWAILAFVLLAFSINRDSIDLLESQTWDYARLSSFPAFCNELRTDNNTESQMPLGMFSAWAWSRAFGTGEMAMRSLNLLWAAIALAALARIGAQISIPWLPLLFAIQPFVWFSMNTARTPTMEMAGGSLLLLGALACLQRKSMDGVSSASLCLGAILLSGASMQGLIPLAAVATGLFANGLWNRLHLPGPGRISLWITSGLILALGIYYVMTILREAGGSQLWGVSPANLLFVCYEFLGLFGLGPGRQELRAIMKGLAPLRDLAPFIPGMLAFLFAYLVLFVAALKSWLTRDLAQSLPPGGRESTAANPAHGCEDPSSFRVWFLGMAVPIQSAILLFLFAILSGYPFWGRQLAGAFPFWIVALAITMRWARQGLWRKSGRLAGLAIVLFSLTASLIVRFVPQHGHDDYRGAVAEAVRLVSSGEKVWWVADHSGGLYYGLPLSANPEPGPGEVVFAMNKVKDSGPLPDAIIISRPDTFDHNGTVTKLLSHGKYVKIKTLQAFEVWGKK